MRRLSVAVALLLALAAAGASATRATRPRALVELKPHIVWRPIPFGAERKAEMVAYVRRHYGSFMRPTWRLVDPRVIVIHYTDSPTFQSTWNTFANDTPDPELHELPGTCAHFVIDTDGTVYQLVSLGTMCRHTVGLNWTAIGIEQVGSSDAQVLGDRRQITASLRLVRWLRCRFHIQIKNVIGHNESLSSPYHREDVVALRSQTHGDFNHADMQVYRRRLRDLAAALAGTLALHSRICQLHRQTPTASLRPRDPARLAQDQHPGLTARVQAQLDHRPSDPNLLHPDALVLVELSQRGDLLHGSGQVRDLVGLPSRRSRPRSVANVTAIPSSVSHASSSSRLMDPSSVGTKRTRPRSAVLSATNRIGSQRRWE